MEDNTKEIIKNVVQLPVAVVYDVVNLVTFQNKKGLSMENYKLNGSKRIRAAFAIVVILIVTLACNITNDPKTWVNIYGSCAEQHSCQTTTQSR